MEDGLEEETLGKSRELDKLIVKYMLKNKAR